MAKILTEINCQFSCPFLTPDIITPQQFTPTITLNGVKVLTDKVVLIGAGKCNAVPQAPVPCSLATYTALPWSFGTESTITINGIDHLLNQNAKKKCPLGGLVSCTMRPLPAINKKMGVPSVDVSLAELLAMGADILTDEDTPSSETSDETKQNSPKNTIQESSSETKQESEETNTSENSEADSEQVQNLCADILEVIDNVNDVFDIVDILEKETPSNTENAGCDFASCPHRNACEYLKASPELYPDEKESASITLRKNSRSMEQNYLAKDLPLQEQSRLTWGNAAHHVISIKDAFGRCKQLVKLAHFYGYDINSQKNCIFLPSNREQGFGKQGTLYKQASAYDVMSMTGLQWHLGHHNFQIDSESFRYLSAYEKQHLKPYNDILLENLSELLSQFLQRHPDCFYDDPETMQKKRNAEEFINMMNDYAEEVRMFLQAFRTPKASFPYFVSREALNYTYQLPRTGKFICAIFHPQNHGWKLLLYGYERLAKNEYEIQLTEKDSFIADYDFRENIGELITFCRNVRIFFIFDMYSKRKLPFQTECKIYYIHNEGGRYFVDTAGETESVPILQTNVKAEKKLSSREIIAQIKPMFSAVLMHEQESRYISPSMMIAKRKKECGI
ncbi:MAG TPA: hypothetical protein DCO72_05095 [Ruminococcus sp.]|nr:hypothetical protein [Ruminococcus sp.]